MSRDKFYEEVKAKFPDISAKADMEYNRIWGFLESDISSYSWFESLAKALNIEMGKDVPVEEYQNLFLFIARYFNEGDKDVKNTIDVVFVENLFWHVPSKACELYWNKLPEQLKELYLSFHRKKPF